MDATGCWDDDDALLRELAALLPVWAPCDATLTRQQVAAAGRVLFAWQAVQDQVAALLSAHGPLDGDGTCPPVRRRRGAAVRQP